MDLLTNIIQKNIRSVSLIGMAKNTGKTETLNHLLKIAEIKDIRLAITTIGLDGEDKDKVMNNIKPKILISEGTIIANAKSLILKSGLNFEILALTDIRTPLGKIVIAKSRERGFIELSGPSSKHELNYIIEKIKKIFSGLILVDGALDRKSFSSPSLTDSTILAAGAVIADSISSIVAKIAFQVELFNLKKSDDKYLNKIAAEIKDETKIMVIDNKYQKKDLKLKTALNNMDTIIKNIDKDTKCLIFNGAVVDNFLEELMHKVANINEIEIIVRDATHLFFDPIIYRRFKNKGGKIKVTDEINILGVTVNPFSPDGSYIEPLKLLEKTAKAIQPIPCYEIVLFKKYTEKGVENIEVFK